MTRQQQARQVAGALADLLRQEGGRDGLVWQQRLRQVAHNLSVEDASALAVAREDFDSLYAGGRNFADFHIWRTDEAERIALNERVSELTDQLRRLLHEE